MTGGDIAGLIAAGVFAVLVALLAVPIIKLGRVFDELRLWIRDLNAETEPLIDEVVRTVATTNSQLEKVDGITDNVSDASANVSAMTSLVASTVGQPIIKMAAFSSGVRRAFSPEAARSRRAQERQMREAESPHVRDTGSTSANTTDSSGSAPSGTTGSDEHESPAQTSASSQRPWWEGTEFDTPGGSSSTPGESNTTAGADEEPVSDDAPVVIEMQTPQDSAPGDVMSSARPIDGSVDHTAASHPEFDTQTRVGDDTGQEYRS